jgi:hypothetical protein
MMAAARPMGLLASLGTPSGIPSLAIRIVSYDLRGALVCQTRFSQCRGEATVLPVQLR